MNAEQTQVIQGCAKGALSAEITFPEIVDRLAQIGAERYHADYSRREITYSMADGDSLVVATPHPSHAMVVEFTASAVEAAVRQSQRNEHTYLGLHSEDDGRRLRWLLRPDHRSPRHLFRAERRIACGAFPATPGQRGRNVNAMPLQCKSRRLDLNRRRKPRPTRHPGWHDRGPLLHAVLCLSLGRPFRHRPRINWDGAYRRDPLSATARQHITHDKPCTGLHSDAELGTNWEQDWRHQTNATTMSLAQGGIVRALKTRIFNVTATCSQHAGDGRRAGLKIRSL
jgi:hypothetical protein